MRWFSTITDAVYDLEDSAAGEVTVIMEGSGIATLGYLDSTDTFAAFLQTEATMTAGDSTVCASGQGTNLQVSLSGSDATTRIGVAQIR